MTFKEEESMLLLQLQKIEKQSIKLHENIRLRMKRAGIEKEDVTLNDQTSELYEMAQELNGQVAAVQASIEASARDKIITEYGEGPVKVVFELEFFDESQGSGLKNTAFFKLSGSTSYITLLLWPPTPVSFIISLCLFHTLYALTINLIGTFYRFIACCMDMVRTNRETRLG
jgi:hypothetical protein